MDLKLLGIMTTITGLMIIYINLTFFGDKPQIFAILNMIAAVVAVGIPLVYRYLQYSKIKKVEAAFPKFLSDVTSNINTVTNMANRIKNILFFFIYPKTISNIPTLRQIFPFQCNIKSVF